MQPLNRSLLALSKVGVPVPWAHVLRYTGRRTAKLLHGRKATDVRLTEVTDLNEKRRVMRAYPSIQPLGVYPFRIMGHVGSSDPDEWESAAALVKLFRIDPVG